VVFAIQVLFQAPAVNFRYLSVTLEWSAVPLLDLLLVICTLWCSLTITTERMKNPKLYDWNEYLPRQILGSWDKIKLVIAIAQHVYIVIDNVWLRQTWTQPQLATIRVRYSNPSPYPSRYGISGGVRWDDYKRYHACCSKCQYGVASHYSLPLLQRGQRRVWRTRARSGRFGGRWNREPCD
jgi:hypothetical protein